MGEPDGKAVDLPDCGECGHPAEWHRLDSASNMSPTDPAAKFRCIGYDCTVDGPIGICGCGCPDYREDGALTHDRRGVPLDEVTP